uniref:Phospholipase A2 inhibitor subunit gamma B-like protein n=1 Tax=Crotalus horridus TaxID=35024 RepID=T1DJP3_CROHD
MQILLGYFLFSILLRTGATFQCIKCHADATTCTASLQACNAGENSCVKRLSEDIKGEKTQSKVVMACIGASHCTKQFIELSYEKGVYVRVQYDCCDTDGCTPPSTKMPALNTTINKKFCPVCSLETGTCSDDVTLECTGSATHCFASSILKDGVKRPVKGCTTEAVCNILKTYKGSLVGNSMLQDVTCKEATSDSSCSSLEVFLLALLPMKLLFFSAY